MSTDQIILFTLPFFVFAFLIWGRGGIADAFAQQH